MNVVGAKCTIVVLLLLLVIVGDVVFAQFLLNVQGCNFGNYYFALTNSLIAAQHCPITCVVRQPHANAIFKPTFESHQQQTCDTSCRATLKNITGAVSYKQITRFIAMPAPSLHDRIESLCPFIDNVRRALPIVPQDVVEKFTGDDTLVVHIRSGDIFTTSIHPRYWQPPLGYYQYAATDFDKIVVCSQNTKNPVVNALYDYCVTSRGLHNCMLRVGTPLHDDVAFLLHAHNIAVGWGTFGVAIYAMSAHIRRFYYPSTLLGLVDYLVAMPIVAHSAAVRCEKQNSPSKQHVVGIRIGYNVSQVTKNERWRADASQIAMLLINQTELRDLHEEAIENLF